MPDLRALASNDVKTLNLNDWSAKIELIGPDGTIYNTDAVTGETLKALQVLYDYRKLDPDTGEEITVHEPVITVHRSSLARIPAAGERWAIRFPLDPLSPDTLANDYVLSETRAPEGGASLSFIRFYPIKAAQSA